LIKNGFLIGFITLVLVGGIFISFSFFPRINISVPTVKTDIDSSVSIKIGQTAVISEPLIRVTLNDVLADSRCPIDVDCIWEGDVIISVAIFSNNYQAEHNISLSDVKENKITFLSYFVKFQAIEPQISSNIKLSKDAYIVTFLIGEYGPD
jgi:hypothetical protein